MTNNTNTEASIASNAAEEAREALAASLIKARTAGTAVLTKLYGEGADAASIGLAVKAAKVLAGGDKPRGGAAQRINDTIKAVTAEGVILSPATLATAARAVLDSHKAAEQARRKEQADTRAAAKDVLNDRGRPVAERRMALEIMSEIDAEQVNVKQRALSERVHAAIEAARNGGMSAEQVQSIVLDVFPVLDVRPEALHAVAS